MTFQIHTYGCKVNTYDSGLLESRLKQNGFIATVEAPRVHILNTCAVTREATREAVKTARRLKARDPFALVVVTGCAAQVDTADIASVPGVDLVVANSHKGRLEHLLRAYYRGELSERVHKSNIFKKDDLEAGGGLEERHTRSFLKIQDGCDSFCTFCVIPFARGRSRSVPARDLVARVRDLNRRGVREIVLTGVHIADYRDGARGLDDLVAQILDETEIERLRLSSLEPGELSDKLFSLYQNPRLCRHFHMSIQSANSRVLHAMKRQYTAEAVDVALERIARDVPGSFVGMDVIAGFPGETDDEFADTYARLERLPWSQLHVFPYSARPGTYAARLTDHATAPVRKMRARRLRELSALRLAAESERQRGRVAVGLALANGTVLTQDYWTLVLENGEKAEANVIVTAEILAPLNGTKLRARRVQPLT